MSNEWKEEKGNTVTVYDRYRFAVPVRGKIKETKHDSFKVDFFTNNPGGHNVNKHDDTWFLKGQCKIDEQKTEDSPTPKAPSHPEKMNLWWEIDEEIWEKVDTYSSSSDSNSGNPIYIFNGAVEGSTKLQNFDRWYVTSDWFLNRKSALIPPEK